jgi:hypothetical protein
MVAPTLALSALMPTNSNSQQTAHSQSQPRAPSRRPLWLASTGCPRLEGNSHSSCGPTCRRIRFKMAATNGVAFAGTASADIARSAEISTKPTKPLAWPLVHQMGNDHPPSARGTGLGGGVAPPAAEPCNAVSVLKPQSLAVSTAGACGTPRRSPGRPCRAEPSQRCEWL